MQTGAGLRPLQPNETLCGRSGTDVSKPATDGRSTESNRTTLHDRVSAFRHEPTLTGRAVCGRCVYLTLADAQLRRRGCRSVTYTGRRGSA